jgi:hypothetical protein
VPVVALGGERRDALEIRPLEEALAVAPTRVGVWGEQMRSHFEDVHDRRATVIGAPRFDGLLQRPAAQDDGSTVLVVGDGGLRAQVEAAVPDLPVVDEAEAPTLVCSADGAGALESALLGRRHVIVDYETGSESRRGDAGPPDHARWQGLEKLRGIRLCREPGDLAAQLSRLDVWPRPDREEARYWIDDNGTPYPERLMAFVAAFSGSPSRAR